LIVRLAALIAWTIEVNLGKNSTVPNR